MKTDVLSILVHGASKAGKSTLASTAPGPILVLDAEGSWRFIREAGFRTGRALRFTHWDAVEGPPRADGTWDVCLVPVTSWETVLRAYAWLTQAPHDFVTVVLDSITELQRRCKANISPDSVITGYDGWGKLLAQMDEKIRGFRDLTIAPGPVRCAVFIAETREEHGKWRPYMQGQISVSLPYWVDICAYAYRAPSTLPDGNPGPNEAHLFVDSHPLFESGERVQGVLPPDLVNPNLTNILATIYPPRVAIATAATEGAST